VENWSVLNASRRTSMMAQAQLRVDTGTEIVVGGDVFNLKWGGRLSLLGTRARGIRPEGTVMALDGEVFGKDTLRGNPDDAWGFLGRS